jgi:hypothetical protein
MKHFGPYSESAILGANIVGIGAARQKRADDALRRLYAC